MKSIKKVSKVVKRTSAEKPIVKANKASWKGISDNLLLTISFYFSKSPYHVYQLSRVCSNWRAIIKSEEGMYFWKHMPNCDGITSFPKFKDHLVVLLGAQQQKMSVQFEKLFARLFDYGSTKENIPNKLINKLDLEMFVKVNNSESKVHPFKLRSFNFSSYLCAKCPQISELKFDFYTPHNLFKDKLSIEVRFYSRRYKATHIISYKQDPEEIVELAIKQKAFNYFLDKNIVLTFFEGDNHFLYFFFEISVLQLVTHFRKQIKGNNQAYITKKTKKVPMYKKLCETEFEDFVQYIKFQSDFELHMSYHNSMKQIFTHCDTKVFPAKYDCKHAYFSVKINDSFQKVATYKLDNKMGMSESVDGLYLLDLVVKDRDKFLIVFSGFIYGRVAQQKERERVDDYFEFAENDMRILQFKCAQYDFRILIIEEQKRNLIKNIELNMYPS